MSPYDVPIALALILLGLLVALVMVLAALIEGAPSGPGECSHLDRLDGRRDR